MSTSQMITLCVQNIAHKNKALHVYVSPRVKPRELYRLEIALKIIITVPSSCLHFYGTKSGIKLSIFALEQKFMVHCNGLQKTFLLSYHTTKSEQVENSLVLPNYYEHKN